MQDTDKKRFSILAIAFHWSIALIVLSAIALSYYMYYLPLGTDKFEAYALHKSLGVLALLLMLPRLLERVFMGRPPKMSTHKTWERALSSLVTYALLALLVCMPLSGLVMNFAKGYPLIVFDVWTIQPFIEENQVLGERAKRAHEYMGYGLQALIAMHVAGALKHLIIDRDNTLYRMLPFKKLKKEG